MSFSPISVDPSLPPTLDKSPDPGYEPWFYAPYPADVWRNDATKLPPSGVPEVNRVDRREVRFSVENHTFVANRRLFDPWSQPARVYTYDVDGQQIEIVFPESLDSNLYIPNAEQVAAAVAALPPQARDEIVRIEFAPRQGEYPAFVTGGAPGTVFISPYDRPVTQYDLDTILLHEGAHLIDQPDPDAWRQAVLSDARYPTAYARNDFNAGSVTEDFAETYQIYHLVKDTPDEAAMRGLYAERFALIDQMEAQYPGPDVPWFPEFS